jgi:hypothetical protein
VAARSWQVGSLSVHIRLPDELDGCTLNLLYGEGRHRVT